MPKKTMSKALAFSKRPIGAESAGPKPAPRVPARDTFTADALQNLVAGLMTGADKRTFNAYPITVRLTKQDLENAFRQSWLAKRIVNTVAMDMCREWVALTWDDYDTDDEGAREVEQAEKVFSLRSKVEDAIRWGRLYGGAGIVIGIKGDTDYSKPLILENVRKGSLQFLHMLDRWRLAATGELDLDITSPNFGYPAYYTVSDIADPRFRVHWTRVVRFGGEPIPWFAWSSNGYWDDSVLQHIIDTIKDYDATLGGIASLVFESNVDIINSPGLSDQLRMPGGEQRVIDRFRLAVLSKSINKTLLLDGGNMTQKGEEWHQKSVSFSGLKDVVEKFMINVSGAADIPMTRLFGQSPAGLTATGESDIRNYYDHVAAKQEAMMRPQLERLYQVLIRSTLGDMPENFAFSFNPLWQTSDKEVAEIDKLRADRDHVYITDGVITEELAAKELLDRRTYRTMEQEDVDKVDAMAKEAAAMQQAALLAMPKGGPGAPGGGGKLGDPQHQEGDVANVDKKRGSKVGDSLKREGKGWSVYAEGDQLLGGPFRTKQDAVKHLRSVEQSKAAADGKNTGANVVGERDFAGYRIAIENPAGSMRTWKDAAGNETGHTPMIHDYGYLKDYIGNDMEELDCYIGPNESARDVFVIHQLKTDGSKRFDEDKILLGFSDATAAMGAWAAHRNDGLAAFGGMAVKPLESFRAQLQRRGGIGKIRS